MSKALKTVGTIAGVVAAVALTAGSLGVGSPATAALLIKVGNIAGAAALGASLGAAALARRPGIQGSSTNITIGPDQPTPWMIGETYYGGAMVHRVGYGSPINDVPNPYLAAAMVYSVDEIEAITGYYADFEPVTFGGSDPGPREATGYLDDILYVSSFRGAMQQTTALAGPWGAIPGWGADARLSGLAHLLWSAKWDSKNGKYQSGLPQLGITAKGARTWNPALDDTVPGGAGPQRWADPADTAAHDAARGTWTWTNRPGLLALRYALGIWQRDLSDAESVYQLRFGLGFRVDQVVIEDFVALEAVCAANNWSVAGVVLEPGDKADNLKRILAAGGAEIAWKGGRLGCRIASPRVSLDTIAPADLAEGAIAAPGGQRWRERINAVIPRYTSPDHKWELQQSAKITVDAWVAEDGEEKPREEVLEYVTDPRQAAQLAAYRLWDAREYGPIDLPVLPRLRRYRAGSRLTLAPAIVDALGLPHGEVVVVQRSFDPATMTGTLTVMGETAAKHAAALAQTGSAPPAITLPTAEEYDGAAARPVPIDLDPPTELTGEQTAPLEVTLTWRAPRSVIFDSVAVVADGVESATRMAGGLGAVMTATVNPAAPGSHVYLIRAWATDGSAPVDSDPITVVVS